MICRKITSFQIGDNLIAKGCPNMDQLDSISIKSNA